MGETERELAALRERVLELRAALLAVAWRVCGDQAKCTSCGAMANPGKTENWPYGGHKRGCLVQYTLRGRK